MENDTDTLLALLSSLLPEPIPDQEILLDALIQCKGNVQDAAATISSSDSKKRKRAFDLDDWLRTPRSSSSAKPGSKRVQYSSESQSSETSARPRSSSVTAPSSARQTASTSAKPKSTNALMNLRPPPSESTKVPPQLPPLTLSHPDLVAQKVPCTLHPGVLPTELAYRLFEIMLDKAESWKRNRWWLFERAVESPHKSSFFVRDTKMLSVNTTDYYEAKQAKQDELREAAHYWTYASQFETNAPSEFPDAMEEACKIIERVVNCEMRKRKRFGLEWGGSVCVGDAGSENEEFAWVPNVAAANCYTGAQENVGFHSDALSSLGPYPTIASLSLGVSRIFRLREAIPTSESTVRRPQSFNIPLTHNSLLIMHPPTQEIFKHAAIPQKTIDTFHFDSSRTGESCTSTSRINITFRFFRPDYRASSIPKCSCGVPTILRPDMKGKRDNDGRLDRYWWTCQNGTKIKNEGKGCGMWKEMDVRAEGRGPFVSDYHKDREIQQDVQKR